MPIYEYRCEKCGYKFEKLQSFSASAASLCPKCSQTASRVISLSSFVLKGTGWYVTDHPSKDRKKEMTSHGKETPAAPTSDSPPPEPAKSVETTPKD
jgi:putative FmdB family regulatory protein